MERYLGVKLINAEPCSQDQYAGAKNFGDLSRLSGGIDREGYKVIYEDGYISWSPKDVFEKTYRKYKEFYYELKKKCSEEYQVRVYEEAKLLQDNVNKLKNFIGYGEKPWFRLNTEEQIRLKQQLMAMQYYLTILVERIENF